MQKHTEGSIYFLLCEYYYSQLPLVKIGFSSTNLLRRIDSIQADCPFELRLIRIIKPAYRIQETWLHNAFSEGRKRGEWFELAGDMLNIQPPSLRDCLELKPRRLERQIDREESDALIDIEMGRFPL